MMISQMIFLASTAAGSTPEQGNSTVSLLVSLLPILLMVVLMYFMLIRPQNKRKNDGQKMGDNLQVGDDITTIGGIMGRVVSIKDETESIVIETGADRSKVRIKKWAIGSCDTVHDEAETK